MSGNDRSGMSRRNVPEVERARDVGEDERHRGGDLERGEEPLREVAVRLRVRPEVEAEHREHDRGVQDDLSPAQRLAAEERIGVVRNRLRARRTVAARSIGSPDGGERADDAGHREQDREPAPPQGGAARLRKREQRDSGRPRGPQPDRRMEAQREAEQREPERDPLRAVIASSAPSRQTYATVFASKVPRIHSPPIARLVAQQPEGDGDRRRPTATGRTGCRGG